MGKCAFVAAAPNACANQLGRLTLAKTVCNTAPVFRRFSRSGTLLLDVILDVFFFFWSTFELFAPFCRENKRGACFSQTAFEHLVISLAEVSCFIPLRVVYATLQFLLILLLAAHSHRFSEASFRFHFNDGFMSYNDSCCRLSVWAEKIGKQKKSYDVITHSQRLSFYTTENLPFEAERE